MPPSAQFADQTRSHQRQGRRLSTVLVAGITLACLAGTADAITWPFIHYTENEGLPTSVVMGIAQDDSGRVWVANRAGIASYDGATWTLHDIARGLPVAQHRDVAIDHTGGVWAVAQPTPLRVSHLVDNRWEQLPEWQAPVEGLEVWEMVAGRDGDGNVALAVLVHGRAVVVRARGHWWNIAPPEGFGIIHNICWQDRDLLIAATGGLYRVTDPGRADAAAPERVAGLPDGDVYAAVIHPTDGTLHVAGNGWYGEWTAGSFRRQPGADALHLPMANGGVDAAIDVLGGLYLGTPSSLFYLHPMLGLEHLSPANGLLASGTTDVMTDHEGVVWITSQRGIDKLPNRRLHSLTTADGLLNEEVTAVLQRRDGTTVLGHSGGLTMLGPPARTLELLPDNREWSRTMDLHEDRDGVLWAAMDQGGLARVDTRGHVRWYGYADGLDGAAYAVTRDRAGRLWVGTVAGVFRLRGDRFETVEIRATPGARSISVRRFAEAADGSMYAATVNDGLLCVTSDSVQQWSADAVSGHRSTYAIHNPTPDDTWVGTGAGLCRLREGRLEPTTAPDPVLTEPVYAIAGDADGNTWFGTASGVVRWNGKDLRRFTVSDGLCGAETNRDALICDSEGRMWIGTNRGVSIYDERLAREPEADLPLWITGYEVDGRWYPAGRDLRLPSGLHTVVVRFSAPTFEDETRLRFSARLEGADTDWSAPTLNPDRSIRYTQLAPGRYRIHIRVMDIEGRSSEVVSASTIVIQPPLWLRHWVVALTLCVLTGLVWLVVSVVQGRRYAHRLVAEVEARTAELARSEEAVRLESRRLGAILASIADGVLAIDTHNIITLANPAAAQIIGVHGTTIVGRSAAELLPGIVETARAALGIAIRHTTDGAEQQWARFEYPLAIPADELLNLECGAAPLAEGGPEAGLVLAFRDTTERRRAEQVAIRTQKLESLGVLAGGIAHDFNNLLTVIMGNASLVGATCTPIQQRPLEHIGTAATRAQRLTTQLLTFARGGSPQKRLTSLQNLLQGAATLAVAGTNVSLECDLDEDLWDAEVDAAQIEQVISNLLINARQAMPQGGHVWIVARNIPADGLVGGHGRRIEIRIRDEGMGIAQPDLDRIFEPYYTTKPKGTGLGLAITYSIVARHGGTMRVVSDLGRGTEFTVLLPASAARAHTAAESAATPMARVDGRVLVMDDEAGVRDLLAGMLNQMGHDVLTVADGTQALNAWTAARASGRPFAVAIVDLTIPGGMGGRETMARLREMDPDARGIVTTGSIQDPAMTDPRRYGFAATLPKPFTNDDLAHAVRAAIG
jgi:PAS domain S-box-containing protein